MMYCTLFFYANGYKSKLLVTTVKGGGLVISLRGNVPRFAPEETLDYQRMNVESERDGHVSHIYGQGHICAFGV